MVMCPKQQQNANWSQVEIENLIVKGRNLPRTNSTKSETQIIFAKKQENEHTPAESPVSCESEVSGEVCVKHCEWNSEEKMKVSRSMN